MINQETADKLGVDLEVLQSTFDGYKVMSQEDIDTLKANASSDSEELKKKYQAEGQQVGKERTLKNIKNGLGLEFEGVKHEAKVIAAIQDHIAKGFNDEEYTNKINSLSKTIEEKVAEFESYKSEVAQKENNRVVFDGLNKEFNKFAGKTAIPIDDLMTLYNAKNSVKFDGDSIKIYNGDEVLKNDLLQPVTIEDSVKNFIESNYLTEQKAQGGRGEGDSKGNSGKLSFDKFSEGLVKQGYPVGSMEHNQKINEAVTQGRVDF